LGAALEVVVLPARVVVVVVTGTVVVVVVVVVDVDVDVVVDVDVNEPNALTTCGVLIRKALGVFPD
jgi:hypothetical protein